MTKYQEDFNKIKEEGRLLFSYIRGSQCHGTNTPTSDTDTAAVYICPTNEILGIGVNYQEQLTSESNDDVAYEIGKFVKLLCNSNPTILEALFVDDEFITYEHPIFKEFRKNRDAFVTKKCFNSFFGYAFQQIKKCRGLNKLITNEVPTLKGPLDFCYTFYKQGSTKLVNWLDNRGLNQKYCGLVHVPNMHDVYGVYYDWAADFEDNHITSVADLISRKKTEGLQLFTEIMGSDVVNWWENKKRLGYSGIVAEDGSSVTLRYIQTDFSEKDGIMLNSVEKGSKPICYISYNADGYAKHLRDYTRYQKWLKERNQERYDSNKDKGYDAKNVSEAFRLMNMAIEIAKGEGVNVNRKNIDREFLLDVKHHKYSYDDVIKMLDEKEKEMHIAVENSQIPEEIDIHAVDSWLIELRNKFYKGETL